MGQKIITRRRDKEVEKRVVFTATAVEGITSNERLMRDIGLSESNKNALLKNRSVRSVTLASLAIICDALNLEPGNVLELKSINDVGDTDTQNYCMSKNNNNSYLSVLLSCFKS